MLSKISSALSNPAETASSISTTLSTKLNDNYPNISKNITDNYSNLSAKFNDNYTSLSSGLTNTRSTITSTFNNGTTYIYSLPASVGDKVTSYTSMFQPVDAEEREITTVTPPNDNLAEGVIKLNEVREEIVNNILSLYCLRPSKECFKYYDNEVIFEDNLIYATGLANLKSSFYGMPKLFTKSTTVSYKVLENTPNVLRIELNQRYTLPYVNRAFVQNCVIVLEFDGQKIVKHSDLWSGKPIATEKILILRKAMAKLVSTFVRVPES